MPLASCLLPFFQRVCSLLLEKCYVTLPISPSPHLPISLLPTPYFLLPLPE
ncbi:hypothetical protein [Moorena producens]|uniref:hypothetical protein n=1 Tax=Moorena producens TaxID=1155739 RepID=UPI0013145F18|nr:hypothetical protein [Moorena producens]